MKLEKLLGFGLDSPLILGMGHPVKDRIKRLTTQARFRKGGLLATMLVCMGAGAVSFAKEARYSLNPGAPILTSDSGKIIQGVPFQIAYVSPDSLQPVLAYEIRGRGMIGPKLRKPGYPIYKPAFQPETGTFPPSPALDGCIDHLYDRNNHTLWYMGTGEILKDDEEATPYIVACIPGKARPFDGGDLAAIHSDISNSGLSADLKSSLLNTLSSASTLERLAEPSFSTSRDEFIEFLRETRPDITETQLESFRSRTVTRSTKVFKINPNLSQAERQKILDEKTENPMVFRSLTLEPGLTEEEKEKKLADWEAELEARLLREGMIAVEDDDEYYELLDSEVE